MFLQDARKGVLFIDFPPVLQLQLKRFEYDFMRDTMVKVGNLKTIYLRLKDVVGNYIFSFYERTVLLQMLF